MILDNVWIGQRANLEGQCIGCEGSFARRRVSPGICLSFSRDLVTASCLCPSFINAMRCFFAGTHLIAGARREEAAPVPDFLVHTKQS
jgi:hypothetical protein